MDYYRSDSPDYEELLEQYEEAKAIHDEEVAKERRKVYLEFFCLFLGINFIICALKFSKMLCLP